MTKRERAASNRARRRGRRVGTIAGVAACVGALSFGTPARATKDGDGKEVLLQAFHWNSTRTGANWYQTIQAKAVAIKDLGVTIVYMPPPWHDLHSNSSTNGHEGYWWNDTQCDDFSPAPTSGRCANANDAYLSSWYGTSVDLGNAVNAFAGQGMRIIYDIVPNHRNFGQMQRYQWTYPGGNWRSGGADTGLPFATGEADVNLGAAAPFAYIRNAIVDLKLNYRASGFRWDFVKGYSATDVKNWLSAVGAPSAGTNVFSVGENWDTSWTTVDSWAFATGGGDANVASTAFDFCLKAQLNSGNIANVATGCAHNNGNAQVRSRAVTFVGNHDTDASPRGTTSDWGQQQWPVPNDAVKDQSYAYISVAPGTPTLYWPDVFDWGGAPATGGRYDLVKSALAARKLAGVSDQSAIQYTQGTGVGGSGVAGYVSGTSNASNGAHSLAFAIGSTWTPPAEGSGVFALKAQGNWGKIWVYQASASTTPPAQNGSGGLSRTIVLIQKATTSGQDMFIRGGVDYGWSNTNRGTSCSNTPAPLSATQITQNQACSVPLAYINDRNGYSSGWKSGDNFLDWGGLGANVDGREPTQSSTAAGTPLEWTTNQSTYAYNYATHGFGYTPVNTFGANYWLLDVTMDCSKAATATLNGLTGQWFEVKAYVTNGPGWEANVTETKPYNSPGSNHYVRCGMINVFTFGVAGQPAGYPKAIPAGL